MPTGPNDHVYTGIDPFVNSAQFDFRLKGPTQPGKALPSPYHLDFVGITRGLDGNWDRGAYEFAPGLYLSSPIGGETWVRGFNHAITWSSSEVTEPVKIELFKASALQWEVTMPITSGTSKWQIPTNQTVGSDYTIKISAGSYTDTSDVFTIAAPAAPIVQTLAAQSITASSALLRGTVHPMGLMTTYYFEYGLTDAYGSATADVNLAAGDETLPVQAGLSDLMASTTYHFRLMATNSEGATEGNDMTLTTSGSGRGSSSEAGGGGGGGCFMATAAPSALWWKGLGIIPGLMFLFLLVNRYGQRRRARHSGRFGWWLRILCKDKQEKIF